MKNKIIFIALILILSSCSCYALQTNSSSFMVNFYMGSGGQTSNITSNASLGFGQVFIGNLNNTLYEGIFYINNITAACSLANLNLCNNSASCIAVGGYWYEDACWSVPHTTGGGGGHGATFYPAFAIYPQEFYETLTNRQSLNGYFFIENLEWSSPLHIIINSSLNLSINEFDIAPGRIAVIDFYINGYNKTGYYNDTINIKVVKDIYIYRLSSVDVNYYVRTAKIINLNNDTLVPTTINRTFIDLLPWINYPNGTNKPVAEQLNAAGNMLNNFTSHPLFLILSLSILIIITIMTMQMQKNNSSFKDFTIVQRNPLVYVLYIVGVGGLIWLMLWLSNNKTALAAMRIWYTTPAFFTIILSILILTTIIILQTRKTENKSVKASRFFVFAIILTLLFVLVKNSRIIARALYSFPEWKNNPWFYVIIISILAIIFVVMLQKRKYRE